MQITQVSLAKGEISPIAAARTDQEFYSSAVQTAVNVFIRREGAASTRPGLQFIAPCSSNTPLGSYLLPFVYNNQQSYVCEFGAGLTRFYSSSIVIPGTSATITALSATIGATYAVFSATAVNSFVAGNPVTILGVVYTGSINPNGTYSIISATSSGFTFRIPLTGSFTYASGGTASVPYGISNPYAITDLPNLRWAQSADTLNIVVATQPLYQLKRLTSASFSYVAPQLLFGPFQDTNTDGTTTVYVSGTQGTITITASSGIFKPSHVGALFSVQEQFLSSINPWTAEALLTAGSFSPVGYLMRSDSKIYKCVNAQTSGDNYATGQYQPVHTSGTQEDGNGQSVPNLAAVSGVSWQFVSTDTGVALITGYISPTQVTAVVQNYKGIWSNFPPTVVGGPQSVYGPFTFSGNGTTKTFSGLTGITTADPNQFYVTVGGIFQDPSTFVISGTSITFYQAPGTGTNNIVVSQVTGTINNIYVYTTGASTPMQGLCLSTYWAFGSISPIQGYPSDVCYYNDRLVLAGTSLQPQTFFCSQASDYLNFGVSDPQIDSDGITETINSRQQNPINNLLPLSNLLLGTASTTWRCTDTSGIGAITPSDISLLPQEFYGMQPIPALQTGTTVVYAQWGGRKIRDIIYQFYTDKFQGEELTVYAQENMFPYGTEVTRMAFSPEPYGLIFCVRSDGVMCVCTYLPEQKVVAWTRYITQGNFEDVQVIPENGTFSVYVIVGRAIGGSYQRYIERFAPREVATEDDYFFVDSGLTYDGRNLTAVTMTLSGGSTWAPNNQVNLNASSAVGWAGFQTTDIALNNAIWLYDASGNRCRAQILNVASTTSAVVNLLDPAPADLQGIATVTWTFARTYFTGANNLIGQMVSIFADGGTMPKVTVGNNGGITTPYAAGVIHAGLPYTWQIQSLNLNVQGQESIRDRSKTISRISPIVDQSSSFLVGPNFTNMYPVPIRQYEPWGQPPSLQTGILQIDIPTYQNDNASICFQGSNPVPVTILGWTADVEVGESGP
jgi:hypothetical protein